MSNKTILIMAFAVVIVGLFYWFQIRPAQIREDCYDYAYGTPNLGDTNEWVTATGYYYDACLNRNGLN